MTTNQEQIEAAARALWYHGANTGTWRWEGVSAETRERYRAQARAVIAAIHPTVSTVEELDALPSGSVILANGGEDSAQNDGDGDWYYWGNDCPFYARDIRLPAMVLHIPGGAA